MQHTIHISVRGKIARKTCDTVYVCGNSDYAIDFDFDAEWAEHTTKTARFDPGNGPPVDVVFSGSACPVPALTNTHSFRVGVYAGNLHTTTAAYVPAKKSILCGSGTPVEPAPDVYAQIMALLNEALSRIEALEQGGAAPPEDDETNEVLFSVNEDGSVAVSGVAFSENADGSVNMENAVFVVLDDGSVLIQ